MYYVFDSSGIGVWTNFNLNMRLQTLSHSKSSYISNSFSRVARPVRLLSQHLVSRSSSRLDP